MRFIKRLSKPNVLRDKEESWRDAFVHSEKKRPESKKYAHLKIRSALNTMSFHKCFYCERKLKDVSQEVDHFIEVAERRDLAFDWDNLYLSCDNCNNKQNNLTIPVTEALDPCRDSDAVIQEHLTFEKEVIRAKNNSAKGLSTIQKYRLDSMQLDYVRVKEWQLFNELLHTIKDKMIAEQRKSMNDQEKEMLLSFKSPDHSFSLMFKVLLEKHTIS